MNIVLVRYEDTGTETFGKLTVLDETFQTIERPWIPCAEHPGGTNGTSCVPRGEYQLVLHDTPTHPKTWALVNAELGVYHIPDSVPSSGGRSSVLIHPANYAHELLGCIAPGMKRGAGMVSGSRQAFSLIQSRLPWTPGHTLTIRNEHETAI